MKTILLLLLSVALIRAEDIYVRQDATGADDGSSTNNAKSITWLNSGANWGSGAGKVSAGDTVVLSGLFTNTARFAASGTLGNRITFQGEASGARWVMSSVWGDSAICLSNFNNITVDGGPNGYIEYTDNGTLLAYQQGNNGIMAMPSGAASPTTVGEITISNWRITNIYVWDSSGVNYNTPGSGVFINGGAITNVVVRNVTVHSAKIGIYVTYGGGGMSFGWDIFSNVTTRCNWGIGGGDGAINSKLNGLKFHHNQDSVKSPWDCDAEGHHHNGTYFWADQSGSSISNSYYYSNLFDPQNTTDATACIFTSSAANGVYHINVYNNVFLAYPGPGSIIQIWGGANARVFNNSFMGDNNTVCVRFLTMTGYLLLANNVFFNIWDPVNITDGDRAAASPFDSDYNSFFALNPNGGRWGDAGQYTWAQWLAGPYDTHSITNLNPANNPLLVSTNSPYNARLQAGSPLIGAGTNVSAFGYPGQSVDFDGVTRATPPAIGAFEYVAASAAPVTFGGRLTLGGRITISR